METAPLSSKKEVRHGTSSLLSTLTIHVGILLCFLYISWVLGWDRSQYCKLNSLAEEGANPYDFHQVEAVTGWGLFLTYPPLILEFFSRACNSTPTLWYLGDALAYLGIVVLTLRGAATSLAHIVFAMNFGGLFVGFAAGNIQLYESLAFTGALVALASRRYPIAGLLLGVAIFIKLQSLLLFPLILLSVVKDRRALASLCLAAIFSFTSLHILSAGLNSALEVGYWQMLWDNVWLRKTDIIIDTIQPTLLNLCRLLAPDISHLSVVVSGVFYASSAYFAWQSRRESRYLYLALLFGFACYPRLAYYSFSLMLFPTIRIFEELSRFAQVLVATCASASVAIFVVFGGLLPSGTIVILSYLAALAVILYSLGSRSALSPSQG